MRRILAAGLLLAALSPAAAQTNDACDQFAWPISREQKLFNSTPVELRSGETLKLSSAAAATVRLRKISDVAFSRAPERSPKNPDSFAGVIEIDSIPEPGLYQLTASEEAWFDVIQNDAFVKSVEHSGKRGCPGVRKSVRFRLTKGLTIVQFSGAEADTIKFAILPVPQ
jgi:hypothetical protein